MIFDEPIDFPAALQILDEKGLLPTGLSSSEIRAEFDPDLRERSLFSARTTKAELLAGYREQLGQMLQGKTNGATARHEIQQLIQGLDYTPEEGFPGDEGHAIPPADKGSLQDLGSRMRVDLVLKTNLLQVGNFGWRKAQTTPGALYWYPCWELVRVATRRTPRGFRRGKAGRLIEQPGTDWPARWNDAGGHFWDAGRMIARKDDPIWSRLGSSALFRDGLDSAVPPFAFGSGWGWSAISRRECLALGIIKSTDQVRPEEARMNAGLAAGTSKLSQGEIEAIRKGIKTKAAAGRLRLAAKGYSVNSSSFGSPLIFNSGNSEGAYKGWADRRGADHAPGSAGKRRQTVAEKKTIRAAHDEIEKVMRQKGRYTGKMQVPGIGPVHFVHGQIGRWAPDEHGATHTEGYGLSHVLSKHGQRALKRLPLVLLRGKRGPWQKGADGVFKRQFTLHGDLAVISKTPGRGAPVVVTSFDPGQRNFKKGERQP